ncbi:hypothetical protein CAEBREN_22847 [Caenorhabditis brenneri]|uniref:Uncharacterized protein n=1 Tax=Caenorhabditis brenneri TaxID=135651 RepID=G0NXN7_CAEBE|nr:hypothetical protein CAEBREN_22847 [Caenorhabditis brenneri]
MVKKITVYTAFGQFLVMVERQAEQEREQMKELETDRYPLEHSLSDYQNSLVSAKDIRVQSCPADFTHSKDQLLKKSTSCPFASFACSHDSTQMIVSPVPTTVETRKLNEATELMMSFWKVHVTTRRPKTETVDDQPISLFEKLNGLFANPSTTSVASLFGKFEELFEEMIEVVNETAPKQEELVWFSTDQPTFPQLPVFVKSPVDSLKIYKGCQHNTDEMADDELTKEKKSVTHATTSTSLSSDWSSSSPSSSSSSSSSSCSSTTIISKPNQLISKVRLQEAIICEQKKIIDEQKKIVDSLHVLQLLTQQLEKLN